MMTRMGSTLRALTASVLVLTLAGILFSCWPHPAQAQQATLNQVTVHPLQEQVYEGGLAQFAVRRTGGTDSSQTVLVRTWETEHDDDPVHGNLTEQAHLVNFPRFSRYVTLNVAVYNDERADLEGDTEELLSPPTAPVEPAPTAPWAPMDLSLSTAGPGELRATWNAPDDDGGSEITGYTLQWKEGSGDWDNPDQVSEVSVTETGHTIAGLTGGTE